MANHHPIIRLTIVVALLIACWGCYKPPQETDAQLHARALSLPLEARYDLYLKVYKSRTPRNPLLAEDIIELGRPARHYALQRAQNSSGAEFGAALTVLSGFQLGCSEAEYVGLLKAIDEMAESGGQREALIDRVKTTCGRSAPKGWR